MTTPARSHRLSFPPDRAEDWIVRAALALVLLPLLLFSSPEFRAAGLLVFGVAAMALGGSVPAVRAAAASRGARWIGGCLLAVHLASFAGGIQHGQSFLRGLVMMLGGTIGVAGIGVLAVVLFQPRWRSRTRWTATALTALVVVSSLAGYFIFIGWHVEISESNPHQHPIRLAGVWPLRALTAFMGQEFWEHANIAAYLFAAAWVVLVDALLRRPRFARAGWCLALLLGVAIFLTASRSAWLMIAAALPFLLACRGWRASAQVIGLLAMAVGFGFAGVKIKYRWLDQPGSGGIPAAQAGTIAKFHASGMVERGSSGRLTAYRQLWDELEGDHLLGRGLAVNRTPVGIQLHEHSSYLASLRGGGLVALAAHLGVLACAAVAAFGLARRGSRWPLLFAIAVFSGLLFDRSTVFRLTGTDEFLLHWFAVWIPVTMAVAQKKAAS